MEVAGSDCCNNWAAELWFLWRVGGHASVLSLATAVASSRTKRLDVSKGDADVIEPRLLAGFARRGTKGSILMLGRFRDSLYGRVAGSDCDSRIRQGDPCLRVVLRYRLLFGGLNSTILNWSLDRCLEVYIMRPSLQRRGFRRWGGKEEWEEML